ncbi:MAG: UDP-N-acetylglucosamine 4,6-dehydratase family protein, partial [Mariniblastus sp.]
EIEDLLQRSPVQLDNERIENEITGKTVMVTGAGGSIGSEICRQLIQFEPKKLILVDHRENSIFLIHSELGQIKHDTITLEPAVADILDRERITELFEIHSPDFVYHAAAHKHVGLMELQPGVAIRNNIIGTKRIADIANDFGITKFVMVSTDKAVNPTSVMGCTKQIAERYCLSLGNYSKTKFVAVRFGNVLGSNGSVVPIFKKQIERGGPVTITDERMTRFFMTIPEASQLVLQAGSMGEGGEIFVLDMGKQVKIVDLAKKMIELAGLPESAIEIQFMGARPGEKLYEELYFEEEEMIPTDHQKIFAANHRVLDYNDVLLCVAALESASSEEEGSIRRLLKDYIPEYDCSGTACNSEKSTDETMLKIHADLRTELSGSVELASTTDD